jgi:large subunit ribosomal protein LX
MEVRVYSVSGEALFNESSFPRWQKFTKYVRAINEAQARERVLSELGSKNKIKRHNVRIREVREAKAEEIRDRFLRELEKMNKVIR